MLVSDDEPKLSSRAGDGAWPAPAPHPAPRLPAAALPYLEELRLALARHRAGPAAAELERAFAAARGLVTTVAPAGAGGRPDLEEMRSLAAAVPEFGDFLARATDEAAQLVHTATSGLWSTLGLRSPAPGWTAAEREAAGMLFACACAPSQSGDPARLGEGLRALAAGRFAERLCAELESNEDAWVHALAGRYASVRHRCAPRTTWRSRGLSDLLRVDDRTRSAVRARLERWLAAGGTLALLGAELEAALVHARTPARFA